MGVFIRTNHAGQHDSISININRMSSEYMHEQHIIPCFYCVFNKPHDNFNLLRLLHTR